MYAVQLIKVKKYKNNSYIWMDGPCLTYKCTGVMLLMGFILMGVCSILAAPY